MRRGKFIHSEIEARIKGGAIEHCPDADAALEWALARHGTLKSEATFGIDPISGLVTPAGNKDAVPSAHVPAVVDLIVGTSETWDFKTGSPFSTFSYEPQVRITAYAVAKWLGIDELMTGLAYVSPTGVMTKSWKLDAFDFAEQKQKLRIWAERAPDAKPTPGTACKYCPARTICPTRGNEAR